MDTSPDAEILKLVADYTVKMTPGSVSGQTHSEKTTNKHGPSQITVVTKGLKMFRVNSKRLYSYRTL